MRFLCLLAALAAASPAVAQTARQAPDKPIPNAGPDRRLPIIIPDRRLPILVFDARGVWARLGQDPVTATGLFLAETSLPSRGLGATGGVHLYPLRGRSVAFGIGAEAIIARAVYKPIDATTMKPTGDVFKRRLRGVSGQMSLNFGHKRGWSYLTAGLGPMSFDSYEEPAIPDDVGSNTLNFGGGARWFTREHLAFTIDLRFYRTKPALATLNTAPRGQHRVFVMSAGMSIK